MRSMTSCNHIRPSIHIARVSSIITVCLTVTCRFNRSLLVEQANRNTSTTIITTTTISTTTTSSTSPTTTTNIATTTTATTKTPTTTKGKTRYWSTIARVFMADVGKSFSLLSTSV